LATSFSVHHEEARASSPQKSAVFRGPHTSACATPSRLKSPSRIQFWTALQTFVPPTVIELILMVGQPTPTGTLCPSFPHVQMPSDVSTSLPSIATLRRTSGPLPIRFTPLSGVVIFPSTTK